MIEFITSVLRSIRHVRLAVAVLILLTILGLGVAKWIKNLQRPVSLNVPLGVEQAAIVTYSGPPIAVAPYKWGVAVNVRIAAMTERPGARIYDLRYLVNRGGTFDLKDYLTSTDGGKLDGLPSFKFTGDPKLSKELDARIKETEEVAVEVGGHYRATLAALAALWIVWLLLLIFAGRPKRVAEAAPPPRPLTFAERLQLALAQLRGGTLDAAGKARLEMLLLRGWQEELALPNQSMSATLAEIERNDRTGHLLRQVQLWMHHPAPTVRGEEIADALAPFAAARPVASSAGPS